MSYQWKYKFVFVDILQSSLFTLILFWNFFFVDSYEPSFNPFPLHFYYPFVKQRTRICNCPTCQTSFGWPCWFRASCKDWSRWPASHRGQVYQLVTTLLRTGKMGRRQCQLYLLFVDLVFCIWHSPDIFAFICFFYCGETYIA